MKIKVLLAALVATSLAQAPAEDEEVIICNRELCGQICEVGHVTDARGCPTCQCLPDPCDDANCGEIGKECAIEHRCTEHPCNEDHVVAVCRDAVPPACPMPMCSEACPFGYKNTIEGCMTCECVEDPCDGVVCGLDHTCLAKPDDMPTGILENDQLDYLCLPTSHVDPFLNRFAGQSPDDLDDLDDLSRDASEVTLVFAHDMNEQMQQEMQRIQNWLHEKLAQLMGVNMEFIVVRQISCDEQRLNLVLTIDHSAEVNVPAILARFGIMLTSGRVDLDFEEFNLTPIPSEFKVNRPQVETPPEVRSNEGQKSETETETEEDMMDYSGCYTYLRAHRGVAIFFLIIALLVIMSMIFTFCLLRKMEKSNETSDQFAHKPLDEEMLGYEAHPDVMIKEKGGFANAYMVSVPENDAVKF